MQIEHNHVVTIHYIVNTMDGAQIDSSHEGEPMQFIHGSRYLIQGLEDALLGKQKGDAFQIEVEPELAYGERHDTLIQSVPLSMFEGMEPEVGMTFRATTDDGEQSVIIIDVDDEQVTVDGNHPLAGVALKFDVEVLAVREASPEELESGVVAKATNCCDDGKQSCCN